MPSDRLNPLRFADYARRLLCIAETVHRWLGALSGLDERRRSRVAGYAERIADTLARAGEALGRKLSPVDAAIVGIVDEIEIVTP